MQTNCTLSEFRNKHQWLEQPNPPEDTALYKRAAIKYLKHINYKSGDKLLIGDTTREVIPFIALESKKWKTVNPNFVTLDQLPIRAIYDQIYSLVKEPAKLNALLEDCVPYETQVMDQIVKNWPKNPIPEVISKIETDFKVPQTHEILQEKQALKAEIKTLIQERKSTMISAASKEIKKPQKKEVKKCQEKRKNFAQQKRDEHWDLLFKKASECFDLFKTYLEMLRDQGQQSDDSSDSIHSGETVEVDKK